MLSTCRGMKARVGVAAVDARGSSDVFLFDRFRLPRGGAGLFCQDDTDTWRPVEIGARAREVLGVLVERHGELVPRDEIMRAVWPGQVIEDHNLSVQISALRRLIDKGRTGGSSIQTVPGRGYRFVLAVTQSAPDRAELAVAPPRLSIVVLPFENLGSTAEKDTTVADAITNDLTCDLSFIPGLSVIGCGSAHAHRGGPKDMRAIGAELRVRYVLWGSTRRVGDALRVNVQLISGETGELLWADRFDEESGESAAAQDRIVSRLKDEIGIRLIDIESARSQRERPNNPDVFDLVLRVRSIRNRPPSFERVREEVLLLERVLKRDPTCVYAMTRIAHRLADSTGYDGWQNFEDLQRAERLLTQARAIEPHSPVVLNTYVLWLRTIGRCAEVIEICERCIQQHPNRMRGLMGIYHELARCKTWMGQAEEGIALEELANQMNPRSPWRYLRHRHIGWYSLLLGRDPDAIEHFERSLAINAANDGTLHWQYRRLAAAYALTGRMQDARQYIARADRLRPCDTARGCAPDVLVSEIFVEQYRRFQGALRLAGLRDHADEDADLGAPSDAMLHDVLAGPTPMEAPGAKTVRTPDLVRLLADDQPVVVDTLTYSWGRSIPGAIGLKYAGLGGSLSDEAQVRLRDKLCDLTARDLNRPVVAVGWNSERFDGRNLALRLAALGHRQVYWYRGGREAWQVAGLPETEVDVLDW